LKNDELLLTGFAAHGCVWSLTGIPLWRGDQVRVKTLAEDFARYIYLPRLKDSSVLLSAVQDGVSLLTWQKEGFAFADSYDEIGKRFRGLRCGQIISLLDTSSPGLLVKGDVARVQLDAEIQPPKLGEDSVVGPTLPIGPVQILLGVG